MDTDTYGGSFLYHMAPNMILLGFVVVRLQEPLSLPYEEFQRWKHRRVKKHLEGANPVPTGRDVSMRVGCSLSPSKLSWGALIGCSAGFLNVPKIRHAHSNEERNGRGRAGIRHVV